MLIGSVALVVYIAVATLLGTIPREDVQTLLAAFRSRGKRSSSELLASAVDENMYDQITQRLPVVRIARVRPGAGEEGEGVQEDEDATQRLPVVRIARVRPGAGEEGEGGSPTSTW